MADLVFEAEEFEDPAHEAMSRQPRPRRKNAAQVFIREWQIL
jgi:hypothetical protein